MDIVNLLAASTSLNWIGKLVFGLYESVSEWGGSFGLTVVFFTLILKAITSPLDLWQKHVTRKNNKIMEEMKPQLEKLQKQYGNDKATYSQKQMALYKEKGYSTLGACLPTLVTLVIFIVVFSGFNSCCRYENYSEYQTLATVYNAAYEEEIAVSADDAAAVEAAESAVVEAYQPQKFFWVKNVFMPDSWKEPVPEAETFMGTGMGKLGITDVDANEYNKVMRPLIAEYNTNEKGKSAWNGFLILPILALAVSILTQLLMKPFGAQAQPQVAAADEKTRKMQENQMKVMNYIMPVMIGVFSLFYSAAFTIYMLVNSLTTLIFNLTYNIITKHIDDKEKDKKASTTFIR